MSDHISQRFSNTEAFEFVLSETDIRKHAYPNQLQWMAHWTRASSSTSLHSHEQCAVTNLIKDQIQRQCYLPVTNMKPSYNCECKNICSHSREKFGRCNRVPKMPACSMNWENFISYNFQNSTSSIPDPKHFPMFDINRKIETVMALNKRTSFSNTMAAGMHESQRSTQLIEFASEGQKIAQTDQEMIHYERYGNANLTYLKHELSNCSTHSVMVSEMKNDNQRYLGSSPTKLKDTSNFQCSRKEETQMCYNASKQLLISEEMVGGSVPSKVTGPAMFEKLTLPSMLHPNLQNPVSSFENMEGVGDINSRVIEKQNVPMVKTDMHLTAFSPETESSSSLQKIPHHSLCPDLNIPDTADTDTSGTKSMDVQSYVGKTSDSPMEPTNSNSELSWKWVKRLRPNPSDPTTLKTKRFKKGDASSSNGDMQNLLSRVVNYNRSISDFPECHKLDESSFLAKNGDDKVKVLPWIRRWCRNSQKKSPVPSVVLCEPENSSVLPDSIEAKQFPSLAAMALMGKQVTNFRPCEFRRKGSTIVWNN